MVELSLHQACRALGPPIGILAVDQLRTTAMARVFQELSRLALRLPRDLLGPNLDTASDLAVEVLLHLVQTGPTAPNGPPTDERARAFLYTCLRNRARDNLRRQQRLTTLDDPDDPIELAGPDLSDGSKDLEFFERQIAARRCFFDEVVPAVSAELNQVERADFLASIGHRRAIAEHRATCDQCVIESFGALTKQTRNRFDKRQGRALVKVSDGLERYIVLHSVADDEADALRRVLQALKDREAFWASPKEDVTS